MGNQKMSGLTKRGGIWHIDKQFRGVAHLGEHWNRQHQAGGSVLARRVVRRFAKPLILRN